MTNPEKALKVAQDFNKDVLKGQLNANGGTLQELARRIEQALDETCQVVWENAEREFEKRI